MPATAVDHARVVRLRDAYRALASSKPAARIRDAADELGVSEAELVMTEVDGTARRLEGDWGQILQRLPALGTVMTLTRNPHVVHEKVGRFESVTVNPGHGGIGLVLGADIDLRIFLRHWRYGLAVAKETKDGVRNSLQFFDETGTAVHKIFLKPESEAAAYDALVGDFAADAPGPIEIAEPPAKRAPRPDAEIDVPALREAWLALEDTHDFVPMLMKQKVQRLQALRLAGEDVAAPVAASSLRRTLEWAAASDSEIMVFVGNRGCIQIHTGPVKNLRAMGPWFNVLDPGFNLHLREDRIASAWVVRKPTADGIITSLELFDAEDEMIATLFGKRKPGEAERGDWRGFAESLAVPGARMIRRRALLALIGCLAAVPALAEPPPLTDAEGKPIARGDASRLVVVGGALTEIVYALGAEASLAAVDTTSMYPPDALKRLPNVGYMRALSAEGVLSLKPTLILAEGDAGPPAALAQLRSAGAALVLLRKSPTPAGVVYKMRATARVLGREAAGETLAAAFETDMAALAAAIATVSQRPKVVFLLSASRGLLAAGQDTAADHMIALAGGVNAIQGYAGYKPLSGEAVIAGKPDMILVTEHGLAQLGGADRLLGRPELAPTPAGKAKRVITLDALLVLGFGPRTPMGVRFLAEKLHPGLALPPLAGAGKPQ